MNVETIISNVSYAAGQPVPQRMIATAGYDGIAVFCTNGGNPNSPLVVALWPDNATTFPILNPNAPGVHAVFALFGIAAASAALATPFVSIANFFWVISWPFVPQSIQYQMNAVAGSDFRISICGWYNDTNHR